MIDRRTIQDFSTSNKGGAFSSVYICGQTAHIFTPVRESKTIRIKYEVYKRLNMLFSVDRDENSEHICLSVKRLDDIHKPNSEWYPEYSRELDMWRNERKLLHSWANTARFCWDKHNLDLWLEIAVHPELFPTYAPVFQALIESKLDLYEREYRLDDHDGNIMVDPETRKVIGIDLIIAF